MPWKECHVVEERLRFIARLLDGEKMAGLCREFGISRKTGYKIYDRYQDCGLDGLTDRSRRPYRHANQLPMQVEKLIVALKKEYPRWGAPKIRASARARASIFSGVARRPGHPTSGTTQETHRASPRTPPATGPARSGIHAAYGAPRRHIMPSAQAVVKRGGGARRTSVSQSWKATGHFVRLYLCPRCPGRGHNQ